MSDRIRVKDGLYWITNAVGNPWSFDNYKDAAAAKTHLEAMAGLKEAAEDFTWRMLNRG